jgi:hypothetical protein
MGSTVGTYKTVAEGSIMLASVPAALSRRHPSSLPLKKKIHRQLLSPTASMYTAEDAHALMAYAHTAVCRPRTMINGVGAIIRLCTSEAFVTRIIGPCNIRRPGACMAGPWIQPTLCAFSEQPDSFKHDMSS